jgi:hypothetical protein
MPRFAPALLLACAVLAAADRARADATERNLLPDELHLTAARLTLDLDADEVDAADVVLGDAGVRLTAARARISRGGRYVRLLDARLALDLPPLPTLSARAGEVEIDGTFATVRDGAFSRCPLDRAGWRVTFREACADADGDVTLAGAALRLFDVPVLWTPWALLRLGRSPGLLPPDIGSREGRGPFLRVAVWLPTEVLDDFELAVTGFPLDDLDFSASWIGSRGRSDVGAAHLVDEPPHLWLHTEFVTATAARSAIISRGLWGQAGLSPVGVLDAIGPEDPAMRLASIRADRFALLGGDFWSVAGGVETWQPLDKGVLAAGNVAFPRMRFGWLPGLLDDTLRAPGAVQFALWRRLDGMMAAADDRSSSLVLGWRQSIEYSPPWLPGIDLRPFVVAAGRRDASLDGTTDWLWTAAGARFAIAAERSWNAGLSYHRLGVDLRWAHTLPVELDPLGPQPLLGPGPDLLRVGLPQILRLGDLMLVGEAWLELRRFDAWDADAAVLGARVAVDAGWITLDGRVALDGAGVPLAGELQASMPLGAPVEFAAHYAFFSAGTASTLPFLSWEERLPALADPPPASRHGLGGDVLLRVLDGRVAITVGAESDLEVPALAAVRFGLVLAAPERCLALAVHAELWLDQEIPNVSVSLQL